MSASLYGIVLVQLISHGPRTALNIYEIFLVNTFEIKSIRYWPKVSQAISSSSIPLSFSCVVDLSHLLLAISSSCNVLIYSVQVTIFTLLLMIKICSFFQYKQFRSLLLNQIRSSVLGYKERQRNISFTEDEGNTEESLKSIEYF